MAKLYTLSKITLCAAILTAGALQPADAHELYTPKAAPSPLNSIHQKVERTTTPQSCKPAPRAMTFGAKAPSPLSRLLRKAPAETSTVSVNFVETDDFEPQAFCLINASGTYWLEEISDDFSGSVEVPDGEYLAIGLTMHYISDWEGYFVYTVKENVSVPATLTIDPTESTSEIRLKALNPSGQPFELTTYRIDGSDWDNAEEVLVSKGNVGQISARTTLYHPEFGELFWDSNGSAANYEESELFEGSVFDYTVRINPGCDNIIVNIKQNGIIEGQAPYIVSASQKGTASATLTNSPSDYAIIITDIAQSGIGKQIMEENGFPLSDTPFSVRLDTFINGASVSGDNISQAYPEAMSARYCGEVSQEYPFLEMLSPGRSDCTTEYQVEVEDLGDGWISETTWMTTTNSEAPAIAFDADKRPVILPLTNAAYYGGPDTPENIFDRVPALFAQTAIQRTVPLGSTPVYISNPFITPLNAETGERFFTLSMYGTGYYGETVGTYDNVTDYKVLYNGKDAGYVAEDYADFWSGGFWGWCIDRASEGDTAGAYDITLSTPMIVDDVEGSLCTHCIFDLSKDDFTAPSVQYFQLRDNEGRIRYEFDYPEQAVLNLMAGDFEWTDVPAEDIWSDGGYLTPKAGAEPKLSYATFGSDDWKELEIEKVSDIDGCFAPAYSARLTQIDEISDYGYFDIKISLSDEAGNSLEQVISPALRISSLSGVANAKISNGGLAYNDGIVSAGSDIAIYNISGVKVAQSAGSLDTSSLAKGVYIAVANGRTIKLAVK